jgi:hypothetical protein
MDVFNLLIGSDVGLASLAVIGCVIVIAAYLFSHLRKLMNAEPGKKGWR